MSSVIHALPGIRGYGAVLDAMTFRERLITARKNLNLSQAALGVRVHAAQSTVATWERGVNEPTLAQIEKLAHELGESASYLAFGVRDLVADGMVRVPEYDVRALSGAGGALEAVRGNPDSILHTYAFPKDAFVQTFGASPAGIAVLEVVGDSMLGTLNPGEKVFVNTADTSPTPPGIFVVWDGMGLVLKRVEYIPHSDPPRVRIISDNKAYQPYERLLDEAYIQGRVVGSWQRR